MKNTTEKIHFYKICPGCTHFMNTMEEGDYCTTCGFALIDECPVCTTKIINPYDKFCRHCGASYRNHKVFVQNGPHNEN